MFRQVFLLVCTMAALVLLLEPTQAHRVSSNSLVSPCPEIFRYEIVDKPGQWTGRLVLRPYFDIKGVWIRLLFDKDIKDVTVDGNFNVTKLDGKQVKVQNRDMLLDTKTEKILKITVTYEGQDAPVLTEYRLNANTICPQAGINRQDVFPGDTKSDYFLQSLKASSNSYPRPTEYKCGVSDSSNPHPWRASIFLNSKEGEEFTCEAVLIHRQYVITSAHCVTFQKDKTVIPRAFVTVYLGSASKNAMQSLVSDIVVHPGYEAGSLLDDLALLKLVTPVEVADGLRPICLGVEQSNTTRVAVFGREVGKQGEVGKALESNVVKIHAKECMNVDPQLKDVLTYDSYCVSYKSDNQNCVGGSGSGLVAFHEDGVAVLEGVVNLGIQLQNKKGCDSKSVAVVTDIRRYLSTIKNVIF